MNLKFYILPFFICLCSLLAAQSYSSIKGKVVSVERTPLEFANISLHLTADSSLVSFALSDEQGQFEFPDLRPSIYFLKVSYIGLMEYTSEHLDLATDEQLVLSAIHLKPSNNKLKEVEVTAKRPMIEIKPGKMVFNVNGTINAAGNNALELLRKAPGVIVTNNDDITLLGQSGVQIYLDGKNSPLSGKDLADFLRTVQASEIDKIEIISNPSSKYDAQGSAGIINVRLKKDKNHGFNSTVSFNYSTGKKPWYIGAVNSNYRDKKKNIFGNYSFKAGEYWGTSDLIQDQEGIIFDKSTTTTGDWTGNNFKIGTDVFLNKESTIGFQVNGFFTKFDWNNDARTPIYRSGQNQPDSVLVSQYLNKGFRQKMNYNLNYSYKDKKGNDLIIDADYLYYRNPDEVRQPNYILDANENIKSEKIFENESPIKIDLITIRVDYERELENGKMELGAKIISSKTDNEFDFFNINNEIKTLDPDRSNQFVYQEVVSAFYAQYKSKFREIKYQIGLRAENTASTGKLTTLIENSNTKTILNYLNFFPSVGLTYKLDSKNVLQFNYSRRVDRPSYKDLNPFIDQKDELNFEQGNPFLTPEFTNKLQLTHSLNYQLHTSISYTHTKDRIVSIRDTIGDSRTIKQWYNLAEQKKISLNVSYSKELKKWWSSYFTLTGYFVNNNGNYDENKSVDVNAKAVYLYSQNYFSLPNSFSLELSGWYNSPAIWGANFESAAIWNIDFGIQKKLLEKRARLSLTISDIFRSSGWYGVSRFEGLTITSSGYSDNRRLSLYFSYIFGNKRVKKNKRKTGAEDEELRIGSGNSNKE